MLLTDGNPNATEELRVYESAILAVANTEMIDLGAKLALGTEEIAQEVLDFLLDHTGADPQAAWRLRIGADLSAAWRRKTGVSDVVVTRQMKRWHAAHTLEIVYRDAFNNQLNDRYQAKFREYRELARAAREQSFHFGIGLSLNPIPQAPAPLFSAVAGPIPATTFYAQASWVGTSGQEGTPSDLITYDLPAGGVPVVQMADPPAVASGFNVYLGLTPDGLALQNPSPIPVGQTFTVPGTGLIQGRQPGSGQAPDIYVSGAWMLRRG